MLSYIQSTIQSFHIFKIKRNMMRLNCPAQSYAWGKYGENSLVASLKRKSDSSFEVSESKPYAELWMGTHPNGPATISSTNTPLKEWLRENSQAVGRVPERYSSDDLPFLFKVLSVRTALSIQSHPDIPLAKQLHATQPQHYKDANHKPEMSVALTPFEAMCGFRPLREVRHHLSVYPELAEIVGEDVSARFLASNLDDKDDDSDANRALLKDIFSAFMRAPDDLVTPLLEKLTSRLGTTNTTSDATEVYSSRSTQEELQKVDALILRLHTDFPSDRGALCPLLLNYIELQPGEAFFMGANEPHAYIYGDCVECMALSDNTVRAGLTPKHKDIETLVEMLHYRSGGAPACHMLQPRHVDDCTVLYRPPAEVCSEFEVERSTVPAGSTYALPVYNCGSIAIVVSGNGKLSTTSGDTLTSSDAPTGSIFFIPASSEVRVESAPCANSECVVVYRAHVNLQFL